MSVRVVEDEEVRWISQSWSEIESSQAKVHDEVPSVTFVEVPFDFAVSHRPGTRFGPRQILDELDSCSLYVTDKRVDIGDLRLTRGMVVEADNRIHSAYLNMTDVAAGLPKKCVPVFLGGDHSITDPIIRGLMRRQKGKKFGLIVFDSHFDSRTPVDGREHSGHWMKTVSDVFDHRQTVQLGIDAPIYSGAYMRDAESSGIMVCTPYDIRRAGWPETLESAIRHATRDTDGVYISVDIDCLNFAVAPGTSVVNAGGLLAHELTDAIFEIASRTKIIGMDVVEVSPPLDPSGNTAKVATQVILNFLAGYARYSASN